MDGIPPSAVLAIVERPELVGAASTLESLGVIAGMVFALVTRASYSARLKWFQKLDWWRVCRLLRGIVTCAQEGKSAPKSCPGFVAITNKGRFDDQYGHLPARPGDTSRVWGANSFVVSQTFRGEFRADVARQCGRRMPTLSDYEKCTYSGALSGASDPDVPATAAGVAPCDDAGEGESIRPSAQENAALLGKMFAPRFEDCSSNQSTAEELAENACKYAERYALAAGSRRHASRTGVPNARAGFSEADVPGYRASPEWSVYPAIQELRLPMGRRVQPYRLAECAPTPHSLRGSLEGEGFAY